MFPGMNFTLICMSRENTKVWLYNTLSREWEQHNWTAASGVSLAIILNSTTQRQELLHCGVVRIPLTTKSTSNQKLPNVGLKKQTINGDK